MGEFRDDRDDRDKRDDRDVADSGGTRHLFSLFCL